ncbi:MAG: YhbY family RNA-binding protein [Burkholderiales bacterium]
MLTLNSGERRALRARAHTLKPVVIISDGGLTSALLHEIDLSLAHHELIKVKAAGADRKQREVTQEEICNHLHAAPVQHIGKILVVYRPAPPQKSRAKHRTKKSFQNER